MGVLRTYIRAGHTKDCGNQNGKGKDQAHEGWLINSNLMIIGLTSLWKRLNLYQICKNAQKNKKREPRFGFKENSA